MNVWFISSKEDEMDWHESERLRVLFGESKFDEKFI